MIARWLARLWLLIRDLECFDGPMTRVEAWRVVWDKRSRGYDQ